MASRVPFTESQWEELENQALVFKYLVAGVPVPPHLLFLIRRPFLLSSSSPSTFFFPHFGWNVQEMRMGRKIDAEPGRCRRTDGKKWRCSKEAYPDSKYCERHMHRGKNRSSRKPLPPPNLFLHSSSRRRNMDDFFSIGRSGSVSAEKEDGYKSLTHSHNHNSSDTEKHCFILGTDVGTQERPLMLGEKQKQRKEEHFHDDDDEEEEEEEEQRSMRVYKFLDEWPSSKSSVSTSLFI